MKTSALVTAIVLAVSTHAALAQQSPPAQQTNPPQQGNPQQGNPGQANQGQAPIGITIQELDVIVQGWSAKKDILNKPIYNDANQRIGKVQDLIITPDEGVSYAIIGAGGFLGMGRHDVAIPVEQIDIQDGKFVLPGATKQALKAMPKFDYKGAK